MAAKGLALFSHLILSTMAFLPPPAQGQNLGQCLAPLAGIPTCVAAVLGNNPGSSTVSISLACCQAILGFSDACFTAISSIRPDAKAQLLRLCGTLTPPTPSPSPSPALRPPPPVPTPPVISQPPLAPPPKVAPPPVPLPILLPAPGLPPAPSPPVNCVYVQPV